MPIFQVKSYKPFTQQPWRSSRRGFTLLEVMIVMGIVAALVALAVPRLAGQNNQMRQAVRKLSSISRQLQSTAKLKGVIYRLVIDMKDGEKAEDHQFWVEMGSARTVLSPDEMNDQPLSGRDDKDDDEKPPPVFTKDTKILKDVTLPSGLHIEDVELKRQEMPIKFGKAYIHFFPQGLADEAIIHLKGGEKLRWSLIVHPLTGKTDIVTDHVTLKDLK